MLKIGIIGNGSWALTFGLIADANKHNVTFWGHSEQVCTEINQHHARQRLPNIDLPKTFHATTSLTDVCSNKDMIVLCVPSIFLKALTQEIQPLIKQTPLLCLSKGVINSRQPFISHFLESLFTPSQLAYLSGPNIALEIAKQQPAAAVVASQSKALANQVQSLFSTPFFRIYTSSDTLGIQISGVLKNVIAIAAGCSDGLGLGVNAKSTLITRGLNEILHFANTYHANINTFVGLSGIGDLMTTCFSAQSRNYQVGFQLGQGNRFSKLPKQLVNSAEGVNTTKVIYQLTQEKNIEMPILTLVYQLITEQITHDQVVTLLMQRELKNETTPKFNS